MNEMRCPICGEVFDPSVAAGVCQCGKYHQWRTGRRITASIKINDQWFGGHFDNTNHHWVNREMNEMSKESSQ